MQSDPKYKVLTGQTLGDERQATEGQLSDEMPGVQRPPFSQPDCPAIPPACKQVTHNGKEVLQLEIKAIYNVLRVAVQDFGGLKSLATALHEQTHYNTKLSRGFARVDGKHVYVDWLIPLLRHETAGKQILKALCEINGRYELTSVRPKTDADVARAFLEDAQESGRAGEALLKRVAERLDLSVEALKR